ncbi:acyl carrier protein [Amycolatopsis sp. NBC_00345]|uniref:acyl carrier protein n=1 Tax=Amycolatopsis sp. NBC_00345 TaxID=2975955 RepID=UPI002E263265
MTESTTGIEGTMIDESDVIKVLEQVTGQRLPEAGGETRLFEELKLDSTVVLEVLMSIEDDLGVSFDPEDLEPRHLTTVNTLTAFLREYV